MFANSFLEGDRTTEVMPFNESFQNCPTWMKKSLGFPTKLLHMSPLNIEVMVFMGIAPSVP